MQLTTSIEKLEKSQIKITGELAWEDLAKERASALKKIGENIEIDGFRKGNVPENMLVQQVGEMAVLEEMAQQSIIDIYAKILSDNKIDALGRPNIQITKIATGSPLGFTITIAIMPEINLPDYKSIAKKVLSSQEEITVSNKDLEDAIKQLEKIRYQHSLVKDSDKPEDVVSIEKIKDEDVPKLTEEHLKDIGNFKDMNDFREKLKHNLLHEKEDRYTEKKRVEILDTILQKCTPPAGENMPDILIDHEILLMIAQFEHDVTMSGMKFDDYLNHVKKTRDDLKKDFYEDAKKRVVLQLLIEKIAEIEKLSPDPELFARELANLKETYKDNKDFDENRAKTYLDTILVNQSVIKFLEDAGGGIRIHPH